MQINFHPPLSAFPVALIILVAILEMVAALMKKKEVVFQAIHHAINVNLAFAGVFVTAAFFSGYQAMESAGILDTARQELVARHHNFGRILLFLIIGTCFLKVVALKARRNSRLFYLLYCIALSLSVTLVICSGFTGGSLVFEHGIGVKEQSVGLK